MRMHNPPHPGKVLREFLGDLDVTTAAKHLQVLAQRSLASSMGRRESPPICRCVSLPRLALTPRSGIELQTDFDMWRASQRKQPKIEPFSRAA